MKVALGDSFTHPWPLLGGEIQPANPLRGKYGLSSPPGRGWGWVKPLRIKRFLPLFLLLISLSPLFSQPIPCNGDLFLAVAEEPNAPSAILRGQYNPNSNQIRWDTLVSNTGHTLTALGYRVNDQYLYGLDGNTFEVIRIDNGGNIEELGPALLDSNYVYRGGGITPTGNRFVVMGKDKQTGNDREMFLIRLDRDNLFAARQSILSEMPTQIEDLAFSPFYGVLYGYDRNLQKMVEVNWIFGQITDFRFQIPAQNAVIRALFYTHPGNLLGYGTTGADGTDESLFSINELSGETASLGPGPLSRATDGCSCGYQIDFNKMVIPRQALPCDTVTLIYEVQNASGFNRAGKFLRDTLPDALKVVEYVKLPRGSYIEIPAGTSEVGIIFQDFLLGKDSLVVRAYVEENTESALTSQATFMPLPTAFGTPLYSDDPQTPIPNDPTTLEVATLQTEIMGDTEICMGQTTRLAARIPPSSQGITYMWSTGETTPSIEVNAGGKYTLTVNSACQTASDSLEVIESTDIIFADLGPDRVIEWGERIQLTVETNATMVASYQWTISPAPASSISCTDCPNPEVLPLETTTYTLTLTDEFGCMVTDEITIQVESGLDIPNVFSPNQDGINDLFYFQGKGIIQVRDFVVVNRWGKRVFWGSNGMLNDPGHGWDGNQNGQPLPEDVYFWHAEFILPNGDLQRLNGSLTLIR